MLSDCLAGQHSSNPLCNSSKPTSESALSGGSGKSSRQPDIYINHTSKPSFFESMAKKKQPATVEKSTSVSQCFAWQGVFEALQNLPIWQFATSRPRILDRNPCPNHQSSRKKGSIFLAKWNNISPFPGFP